MKLTIQPNPRFSGAFFLNINGNNAYPCANNATARYLKQQLTQPAPQAVDTPPVNLNRQTATITNGPIGNFTVTIYNPNGSVDDSYDCQNYATAQYLTRKFR